MPPFHFHMSYIKKGVGGGASGMRQYMDREGRQQAGPAHRYIERDGWGRGKDDLVAHGSGNLPSWADSAAHFWAQADQRERKNGIVARHIEVLLPRELSPAARLALAEDIRAVTVGTYFPHSWAIHEPVAKDGNGIERYPHMHLLFSPRRQEDTKERTAAEWFRQVNHGGVKPDRSWATKGRLYDVREAVSLLTNAALAREGHAVAVDHRSLEARGLSRDPARYSVGDEADRDYTTTYRQQLKDSGIMRYEATIAYATWKDQERGLPSIARQYVLDRVRDHVWRFDQSVSRQQEREASWLRELDREIVRTGWRLPQFQARTQEQTRGRVRAGHQRAHGWDMAEDVAQGGVHVRLQERERERGGYER